MTKPLRWVLGILGAIAGVVYVVVRIIEWVVSRRPVTTTPDPTEAIETAADAAREAERETIANTPAPDVVDDLDNADSVRGAIDAGKRRVADLLLRYQVGAAGGGSTDDSRNDGRGGSQGRGDAAEG